MWRLIILALIALLCCTSLFAQSTTVSGQITDAGSQSWNNGTFSFVFAPNPNYPVGPYIWTGGTLNTTISGSINATGGYSVSIPSNSAISPQGSTWTATFCPQASSGCFTVQNVSITGGTQTLNATPPAIVINLQLGVPPILAYSTSEVTGVVIGSQFYLLGTGPQVCNVVSGNNCTTWTAIGGGGGSPPSSAYTFSVSAGTITASPNTNGARTFSGSDLAVVWNSVVTALSTTGGRIFFKNGIYNVNSMTVESATGCNSFESSGAQLAYALSFPSNTFPNGVQWLIEGESTSVWQGEVGTTTVNNAGVVINVTPTAVSSVTAGSVLAGFWQRPAVNCTLAAFTGPNVSNHGGFHNLTMRFPNDTRGNECAFCSYFFTDVWYENAVADKNVSYNTLATGSAPTKGTWNDIGFTSTVSGSGNFQDFRHTYVAGYDIAYDFQSEHVTGTTITAIYSNFACEFGRSATAVFHPIHIDHFVDQENGAGCIWGPQMQQGTMSDIYFDFELGNDANWYSTARGKVAKLSESNCGYNTGLIRYQAVLQLAGIVAELPAASLFTSCGTGFQAFEATAPPSIALTPVSDTFTRPNNNGGGVNKNGIGPQWLTGTQPSQNNLQILSNAAQPNNVGIATGYTNYAAQAFNADQFSKITVNAINASASSFVEAMVRSSTSPSTQTYYTFYCGGTAAGGRGIIKVVAGASTTLASQTTAGCAANDTLELDVVGNTLWAYFDGALDATFTNPVTDSAITSGSPGFQVVQSATNVVSAKNWLGGSFPTVHGTDSVYNSPLYAPAFKTVTNCLLGGASGTASPAACSAAPTGKVAIPASQTTYTVNSTAVTPNSIIVVQQTNDNSGISTATCNTGATTPINTSRVSGTSFAISLTSVASVTCIQYWIIN